MALDLAQNRRLGALGGVGGLSALPLPLGNAHGLPLPPLLAFSLSFAVPLWLLWLLLFHLVAFALTFPTALLALALTACASVTREPGGFGMVTLWLRCLIVGRNDGTWKTHIQSAYKYMGKEKSEY